MKKLVVLTDSLFPDVIENVLIGEFDVALATKESELKKALPYADALITPLTFNVTKKWLALSPNLKVIGNCAVGVDNIDLAYCKAHQIAIVNTPDVLTRATAELTLALLLSVARRIPEGELLCRTGEFQGWHLRMLLGVELKGASAVIVGRGRIGTEVGKLFQALGLKVSFITKKETSSQIEKILKNADVLSLHLPLNPSTRHWLDKKRISKLKPTAIVLNASRGPLIDENALVTALSKNLIFGAGLDVYESEPKIPAKLRLLPNVVLLPHLGSATLKTRKAMVKSACQGVKLFLNGKRPVNLFLGAPK